eukprot:3103508-Pleurochrysis_carterae.AAC.2
MLVARARERQRQAQCASAVRLTLHKLLLDDDLDLLAPVRDVVDLLRVRGGHDDDAVLVADDRVAGANRNLAALDHAVALPRLHRGRACARTPQSGWVSEVVRRWKNWIRMRRWDGRDRVGG